MFIFLTEWVNY